MPEIPAEAVQAAAAAISRLLFSGQPEHGTWMENDDDLARAAVEAAAPILAEHIAGLFAAMAEKYPEGIWPSESDALGALAMRHAYGQAELLARTAFPKETLTPEIGAESEPGTYWERAVLERFIAGGPVDLKTVRMQVAALLREIRPETPEDTEETDHV